MKYVISVGGGIASTLILPLTVIEQHGRDNVELVMCKLPNEDPDVWRLVEAVEDLTRVKVNMIGLGLTPWDVFYKSRMLGNTRIDPCSRILKREQMSVYMRTSHDPATTTLCVGITADEIDRMAAVRKNWTHQGWSVEAPLAGNLQLSRASMMEQCKTLVGFIPRLYLMGMSHNNCGGACIKAGQAQWARLLYYLPDVYDWWEQNEKKFRAEIGEYTILSEGRIKRPMTLTAFREKLQARWANLLPGMNPFDGLEETPPCVHCEAA